MDRIDLHIEVPSVPYKELSGVVDGASSGDILARVMGAREIQSERFRKTRIHTNSAMNSRQINKFCQIDTESGSMLEKAMERFGLSARAHVRILKIARTIADIEGRAQIGSFHVAEAIQYSTLNRKEFMRQKYA